MQPFIVEKREEIAAICRLHHVRTLAVFGSAVREDFDVSSSDIDLRVEFDADSIAHYADNFFDLQDALATTFGRPVDIVSTKVIRNPYFRKAIEESQVMLYAA
jgi:predicted nucleotidyltransferase